MKILSAIVFFGLLSMASVTNPIVKANVTDADCKVQATVRDFTGLDGCRFLLELKDGTRLIPVELSDKDFLFSEGQLVKISYTKMKDAVTACITAAEPVEISCITQIKPGEKPGQVFFKPVCVDTEKPISIGWLNKGIIRNKVSSVSKGYHDGSPMYVLYGNVSVLVFDCYGKLDCEYPLSEKSACSDKVSQLSDFKSVWALK